MGKAPIAKMRIVKAPASRGEQDKSGPDKVPVLMARTPKAPPKAKAPIAKGAPTAPSVGNATGSEEALPFYEDGQGGVPALEAPEGGEAPECAEGSAPQRQNSWQEFRDGDPLYALLGELGEKKVFSNSSCDEGRLLDYLRRLLKPGVAKTKDWIDVWIRMGIPMESQAQVLIHIMQVGLHSEVASSVPDILAELIKGHRVKVKAVDEAITTLFECGSDHAGCLSRMLLLIFPKSPTSEWGWGRVGWSWQQWWKLSESIFKTLERRAAYEVLCELLRNIESQSGAYLSHQQIWDRARLDKVTAALCEYGGFETQAELAEAFDLCLT